MATVCSEAVTEDRVGTTELGTYMVTVLVTSPPIWVEPLNVLSIKVRVPDVALGT